MNNGRYDPARRNKITYLPAQEFKSASTLTPVTFTTRGGDVIGITGGTGAPGVFFSLVGEPNSNKPTPAPALDPLKATPPLLERKETLEEVLTDRNTPKVAPRRCKLSSPETNCDKARTRGARSHLIIQTTISRID